MSENNLSRRKFLEGTGAALVVASEVPVMNAQTARAVAPRTTIHLTVNGMAQKL